MRKGFGPHYLQPLLENVDRRSCNDGNRELIPIFHNLHRKSWPSSLQYVNFLHGFVIKSKHLALLTIDESWRSSGLRRVDFAYRLRWRSVLLCQGGLASPCSRCSGAISEQKRWSSSDWNLLRKLMTETFTVTFNQIIPLHFKHMCLFYFL